MGFEPLIFHGTSIFTLRCCEWYSHQRRTCVYGVIVLRCICGLCGFHAVLQGWFRSKFDNFREWAVPIVKRLECPIVVVPLW